MRDAESAAEVILIHLQGEASLAYTSPYENVRLGSIAACLAKAGLSVRLVDSALSGRSAEQCAELACTATRMVVIDFLYRTMSDGLKVCAHLRDTCAEGVLVAAVGEAAEACSRHLVDSGLVDLVPLGDPEPVLLATLRAGQTAAGESRPVAVADRAQLDLAPLRPHLGAALRLRRVIDISSSRGCTYHCKFCTVAGQAVGISHAGPRWRFRSAEAVVDEIVDLVKRSGVSRFQFVDDNFLAGGSLGRERARAIAAALRARGTQINFSMYARADCLDLQLIRELAEAGLVQVYVGLESGSSRVLERLGKRIDPRHAAAALHNLSDVGVRAVNSYICFEQRQEPQDLTETLDFMIATGTQEGFSTGGLIPMPGTQSRRELESAGLLGECVPDSYSPASAVHQKVRFLDPRLAQIHDFICAVESCLDRDVGWSNLIAGYHRFNDELGVAGCPPELAELAASHRRVREVECALLRDQLAAGLPTAKDVKPFADALTELSSSRHARGQTLTKRWSDDESGLGDASDRVCQMRGVVSS